MMVKVMEKRNNMSIQKNLKKAIKKVPKTKDEIASDIARSQKVEHMKDVVRYVYPIIEKVDSIYDAQTVVNALSGFIMAHVEAKSLELKLVDLPIDLSGEENNKIKEAIVKLIELMKDEPAKELSSILERLGKTLGDYGAAEFLKNPMSELPITKILA
jgi:hypothetical protein